MPVLWKQKGSSAKIEISTLNGSFDDAYCVQFADRPVRQSWTQLASRDLSASADFWHLGLPPHTESMDPALEDEKEMLVTSIDLISTLNIWLNGIL